VVNVDIGAGTIVSLSFCTNYTFELLTGKDISIKKVTYFNESNPETSRIENALPQRGKCSYFLHLNPRELTKINDRFEPRH
jgi:hypothetical protein